MLAMAEIFSIAIFFVIIVLTAIVFFGWIAFMVLRGVFTGIASLFHGPQRVAINGNSVQCPTRGCGANNANHARFCRRCGHALPAAQHVNVRRAAVW
jgi:hypothetical protein